MKNIFLKNIYVSRYVFYIDGALINFSQFYLNNLSSNASESFIYVTTCDITFANFFFLDSKIYLINLQNVINFQITNSYFGNFEINTPLIYCDASSIFPITIMDTLFMNIMVSGNLNGSVKFKNKIK